VCGLKRPLEAMNKVMEEWLDKKWGWHPDLAGEILARSEDLTKSQAAHQLWGNSDKANLLVLEPFVNPCSTQDLANRQNL
jgi:hypothetical protein